MDLILTDVNGNEIRAILDGTVLVQVGSERDDAVHELVADAQPARRGHVDGHAGG